VTSALRGPSALREQHAFEVRGDAQCAYFFQRSAAFGSVGYFDSARKRLPGEETCYIANSAVFSAGLSAAIFGLIIVLS
jgi:hypothetical protein